MNYHAQHSGLGFIALDEGDSGGDGGGDIIGAIAAIGGAIASLFGGGYDDQATNYRPPANSATLFVHFSDSLGDEDVAYDATSQQSLAIGQANGNRLDDIYSYYSAFISGNTNSGASEAAARVIQDAARVNNVSIQRAADLVLKVVGLIRTVRRAVTSPPVTTPRPPVYSPQPAPQPQQYPATYPPVYQAPAPQAASDNSWLWILLLLGVVVIVRQR